VADQKQCRGNFCGGAWCGRLSADTPAETAGFRSTRDGIAEYREGEGECLRFKLGTQRCGDSEDADVFLPQGGAELLQRLHDGIGDGAGLAVEEHQQDSKSAEVALQSDWTVVLIEQLEVGCRSAGDAGDTGVLACGRIHKSPCGGGGDGREQQQQDQEPGFHQAAIRLRPNFSRMSSTASITSATS